MVNRKVLESTTVTPPYKYRFNPAGRVRHVARVLGVKLPPVKGRKPRNKGDEGAFVRAIVAHANRNSFRHAVEMVLEMAGEYRERLTRDERRALAGLVTQALVGVRQ